MCACGCVCGKALRACLSAERNGTFPLQENAAEDNEISFFSFFSLSFSNVSIAGPFFPSLIRHLVLLQTHCDVSWDWDVFTRRSVERNRPAFSQKKIIQGSESSSACQIQWHVLRKSLQPVSDFSLRDLEHQSQMLFVHLTTSWLKTLSLAWSQKLKPDQFVDILRWTI